LGIGWRPQLALAISRRADLGFVEVVAEHVPATGPLPRPLEQLLERGVRIIPHGVTLSLGGADRPDPRRLRHLAAVARRCRAPLVSEHVAFVRAGSVEGGIHQTESGHLLPVARTRRTLAVLVDNVRIAMEALDGLPLALENISALFQWPDAEMDEADFIGELLDRTGARLLLDVSNVHANVTNLAWDVDRFLSALPLDRLAYAHVGGGNEVDGVYHDTHAAPVPTQALDLLRRLAGLTRVPGAMLERDDHFPGEAELNGELDAIRDAAWGRA
jgi:uncharacterized protein (UPF0276 family)